VDGEAKANGADGRRRSSAPFDPVAGMRALADIQAEGLRAASELLERVLEPEGGASSPPPQPWGRDYAALVNVWAELLQRFSAGLAQPVESGAVTTSIDSDTVGAPVRLVLERPELLASATAEIWVHNGTPAPVGPLALRCGPLTAADGTELDGVRMQFDPAEVSVLPPRSSRGVVVSLARTGSLRPGVYRGTIQAEGAPKLWLPLELAVQPC
jgi:hypothetical protein